MMRRAWPQVCDPAWGKAALAYGDVIGRMLENVADELRKDDLLAQSLRRLNAGPEVEEVVSQVLQGDARAALGGGGHPRP
ncbi:MAG: hypothetical protein ACNA7J_14200 [Wenzhouxiangella sp.]